MEEKARFDDCGRRCWRHEWQIKDESARGVFDVAIVSPTHQVYAHWLCIRYSSVCISSCGNGSEESAKTLSSPREAIFGLSRISDA